MDNLNITKENGITTIYLKGRIDTLTSLKIDEQIQAAELTNQVIIDTKDLQYIASSGLGVILKVAKKHRNLKVIHVNEVVYGIFEVTGFTDILDIEKNSED